MGGLELVVDETGGGGRGGGGESGMVALLCTS